MPATDSLTYLALGDSYTIGQSVPPAESFPFQLAAQLNGKDLKVKTPKIIATTGWITDQLIAAINNSDILNKKYDFVTLLIGVNDQFGGYSQANYRTKFVQVLNTAITFANGDKSRVFVLSIPDYGVTPFAGGNDVVIGPQIDQFNAINKDESARAGVNYVDITDISRLAANSPVLIANDGLHPSGSMYELWVNRLGPLVAASLKK
jgi:lysophospholipase L1-like esterase